MRAIDLSHDPKRKSWVSSANAPDGDFPIQNLPFCAFRRARSAEEFRGGVAIGDSVLDLGALHELGVLDGPAAHSLGACAQPFLNALMGLGPEASSALRAGLSAALRTESTLAPRLRPLLIPQEAAEYRVAAQVGDYTDFYASIHHATAVGKLLRPDNPLFPNYKWLPVAYHGRASSIRVSGYDFARPAGQVLPPGAALPELAATRRLDYEPAVGVFVRRGRHSARGAGRHRTHARRGSRAATAVACELPRLVVDHRADARASHGERLQPEARGPPRQRHAVRPAAAAGRVAPRADERGQA